MNSFDGSIESIEDERNEAAVKMYEDLEKQVGELLAVIHRDGGHYQKKYGTQQAINDAIDLVKYRKQF